MIAGATHIGALALGAYGDKTMMKILLWVAVGVLLATYVTSIPSAIRGITG